MRVVRQLFSMLNKRSLSARLVERSPVVLLPGGGKLDKEIAAELSISAPKAASWRNRFLVTGLDVLQKDTPRAGHTPRITSELVREVIAGTTQTKPAKRNALVDSNAGRRVGTERFQFAAYLE